MAGLECRITIEMQRRRAVATLHRNEARGLGLGSDEGDYACFVLLASTEAVGNSCTPVFICEFLNGRVGNIHTERVSFVDTDEEGVIL